MPVTFVLYAKEGHGLRNAANRLSWTAIGEQFLAQCLGGRAEPMGDVAENLDRLDRNGGEHISPIAAPGR